MEDWRNEVVTKRGQIFQQIIAELAASVALSQDNLMSAARAIEQESWQTSLSTSAYFQNVGSRVTGLKSQLAGVPVEEATASAGMAGPHDAAPGTARRSSTAPRQQNSMELVSALSAASARKPHEGNGSMQHASARDAHAMPGFYPAQAPACESPDEATSPTRPHPPVLGPASMGGSAGICMGHGFGTTMHPGQAGTSAMADAAAAAAAAAAGRVYMMHQGLNSVPPATKQQAGMQTGVEGSTRPGSWPLQVNGHAVASAEAALGARPATGDCNLKTAIFMPALPAQQQQPQQQQQARTVMTCFPMQVTAAGQAAAEKAAMQAEVSKARAMASHSSAAFHARGPPSASAVVYSGASSMQQGGGSMMDSKSAARSQSFTASRPVGLTPLTLASPSGVPDEQPGMQQWGGDNAEQQDPGSRRLQGQQSAPAGVYDAVAATLNRSSMQEDHPVPATAEDVAMKRCIDGAAAKDGKPLMPPEMQREGGNPMEMLHKIFPELISPLGEMAELPRGMRAKVFEQLPTQDEDEQMDHDGGAASGMHVVDVQPFTCQEPSISFHPAKSASFTARPSPDLLPPDLQRHRSFNLPPPLQVPGGDNSMDTAAPQPLLQQQPASQQMPPPQQPQSFAAWQRAPQLSVQVPHTGSGGLDSSGALSSARSAAGSATAFAGFPSPHHTASPVYGNLPSTGSSNGRARASASGSLRRSATQQHQQQQQMLAAQRSEGQLGVGGSRLQAFLQPFASGHLGLRSSGPANLGQRSPSEVGAVPQPFLTPRHPPSYYEPRRASMSSASDSPYAPSREGSIFGPGSTPHTPAPEAGGLPSPLGWHSTDHALQAQQQQQHLLQRQLSQPQMQVTDGLLQGLSLSAATGAPPGWAQPGLPLPPISGSSINDYLMSEEGNTAMLDAMDMLLSPGPSPAGLAPENHGAMFRN